VPVPLRPGARFRGLFFPFPHRDRDSLPQRRTCRWRSGIVPGPAHSPLFREHHQTLTFFCASARKIFFFPCSHASSHLDAYLTVQIPGGARLLFWKSDCRPALFWTDDPLEKLFRIGTLNFQVIGVSETTRSLSGNDALCFILSSPLRAKTLECLYCNRYCCLQDKCRCQHSA